ncbi:hypothetical protein KA005_47025 [bacterium]|nr:hypothetical protein [bacterium]
MVGLFLDTATQIARHWHSDSEREKIRKQLKGCDLYCSHYVKNQYKATLLNSIIYLHNLLLRFKDLKRALREARSYINAEIAKGKLTFGVQLRIHDIGLWILEFYKSYEEQKLRLEDLIEDVWETQFHEGVNEPLIDETSCVYAKLAPELEESGAYKPIKVSCAKVKPPDCRIKEFWDKHQIQLEALSKMDVDVIKAEPRDTEELKEVKENAVKVINGESPHGRRCTVHLSDAIICLESTHCPEVVAVHSINKKHFRPLGEVLGVEWEPKD